MEVGTCDIWVMCLTTENFILGGGRGGQMFCILMVSRFLSVLFNGHNNYYLIRVINQLHCYD